jgi:hypothetical protein
MILKTYTRIFTTSIDLTLRTLKAVHGREPHLDFVFGDWRIVALGDVLVVGGTEESLAPIRGSFAPGLSRTSRVREANFWTLELRLSAIWRMYLPDA